MHAFDTLYDFMCEMDGHHCKDCCMHQNCMVYNLQNDQPEGRVGTGSAEQDSCESAWRLGLHVRKRLHVKKPWALGPQRSCQAWESLQVSGCTCMPAPSKTLASDKLSYSQSVAATLC